jgi:hypothetical protein
MAKHINDTWILSENERKRLMHSYETVILTVKTLVNKAGGAKALTDGEGMILQLAMKDFQAVLDCTDIHQAKDVIHSIPFKERS